MCALLRTDAKYFQLGIRHMNETSSSEKKGSDRPFIIAMALAIIVIVLAVALVATVNSYTSIIRSKDFQIGVLTGELFFAQNHVNDYRSIVNLAEQTTWVASQNLTLGPQSDYEFPLFSASYAGYVSVMLQEPAQVRIGVSGTYFRSLPTEATVLFSHSVDLTGSDKSTYAVVLPCDSIFITVSNFGNQAVTLTVTITYYY